ncbi:Uncharacterized protein FWK35_00027338, partial [Aphis craccivora]
IIFSNSVSTGLKYYRDYVKVPELRDCEETEHFSKMFNDIFDSLNRKFPAEGIRKYSNYFKVLEDTLKFIDEWELNVVNKKIEEHNFLTKQTAEGLRVTIKSTMELSKYFLEEIGFKYVLSNKMNQDKLEHFFGVVRQSTGPNDHPSTPTFLQVYKILSAYSILKPPKSGNCTILETTAPKINLHDIKAVFNTEESVRSIKIQNLAPGNSFNIPEATLANIKSRGGLIHPNQGFFKLISAIEDSFEIHCNTENVFQNCVDELLSTSGHLTVFPCSEHKTDITTYIISFYITMRMRQHTALQNKDLKKKSSQLKKNLNW